MKIQRYIAVAALALLGVTAGSALSAAQTAPEQNAEISLYNLAKDISERKNLAARQPERVKQMLNELVKFRKLRPKGGVPPMVEPVPKGWKPPENWDVASPINRKTR